MIVGVRTYLHNKLKYPESNLEKWYLIQEVPTGIDPHLVVYMC